MYKLFDEFISKYDNDNQELEQYWYENDYEKGEDILKKFSEDDWKLLIENIPKRSITYKKRLVYCLTDTNNIHHLNIISQFVKTNDLDLFMKTIYVIINNNFELSPQTKDEILKKINYYMPKVNPFKQYVFDIYKRR